GYIRQRQGAVADQRPGQLDEPAQAGKRAQVGHLDGAVQIEDAAIGRLHRTAITPVIAADVKSASIYRPGRRRVGVDGALINEAIAADMEVAVVAGDVHAGRDVQRRVAAGQADAAAVEIHRAGAAKGLVAGEYERTAAIDGNRAAGQRQTSAGHVHGVGVRDV